MRRGLVLGGGGVLGFAWMVGALKAVQDTLGWDPREADYIVGTSAGSVLSALVGAGVETDLLVQHQRGLPIPEDLPRIEFEYERDTGGVLPPRPEWRLGSSQLLLRAVRRPRRYPPFAALSSLMPRGRGSLEAVGRMVDAIVPPGEWVEHPATWIIAMDYDTGRRVAFGRPGAPTSSIRDAVVASCAIPGWYAPIDIGGRRYVDGGTCSPTSLDLLAGEGLDEVVVLAPAASFDADRPATVVGRLERRLRRAFTRRVLHEAAKVRRSGARVTILAPGREDLEVMGVNLMDFRRREQVFETSLKTSAAALAEMRVYEDAG